MLLDFILDSFCQRWNPQLLPPVLDYALFLWLMVSFINRGAKCYFHHLMITQHGIFSDDSFILHSDLIIDDLFVCQKVNHLNGNVILSDRCYSFHLFLFIALDKVIDQVRAFLGDHGVIDDTLLNFVVSIQLDRDDRLEEQRSDGQELNGIEMQLVVGIEARFLILERVWDFFSYFTLFRLILWSQVIHVSGLNRVTLFKYRVVERTLLLWNSHCAKRLHPGFVYRIDGSVRALAKLALNSCWSKCVSAYSWSFHLGFSEPRF